MYAFMVQWIVYLAAFFLVVFPLTFHWFTENVEGAAHFYEVVFFWCCVLFVVRWLARKLS